MAYLDENGLEHFWGKIKDRMSSAVAPKANDADVVHKTGDETVQDVKTFQSTESGNSSVKIKTGGLVKGTNPENQIYISLQFVDSDSSHLSGVTYTAPTQANPRSGTGVETRKFVPAGDPGENSIATLFVGFDSDGISYAIAPNTSSSRNESRDIVTRGFLNAALDEKLPLSGGTLTGALIFNGNSRVTSSGNFTKMSDSASMYLCGGSGGSADKGAFVMLTGSGASSNAGRFLLSTGTVNSSTKQLIGLPDGTLTWDGQAIQTASDERLKTPLYSVPDEVLDAWEDVNWGQFQYLDAIGRKGESARFHLGLIAQHVMSVFGKHGLDACAYGILCHEERPAVDEEETVVDADAYVDEEGVEHPAVTHVETRHEDAVDLWMVRYAEAQAMEACCARRENARLKKRVADLEERLAALELKIS